MFVFVDKTRTDKRNTLHKGTDKRIQKYGYSMRGKPPRNHTLLIRGEISAIAGISVNGLLDVMTTKGTIDGETFYNYVNKYL